MFAAYLALSAAGPARCLVLLLLPTIMCFFLCKTVLKHLLYAGQTGKKRHIVAMRRARGIGARGPEGKLTKFLGLLAVVEVKDVCMFL